MKCTTYVLLILLFICVLFFCSTCDVIRSFFPIDENTYELMTTFFPGEDFESGVFPPGWEKGGEAFWSVTDGDAYSGTYSLRSGHIGDSEETYVEAAAKFNAGDSINFYYKVSSEECCDYLSFFIDDQSQWEWSGEKSWAQASFEIDKTGITTLRWEYYKDSSVSGGQDCAWIDKIERIPWDK